MKIEGNILKMKSKLDSPVEYMLPIGDELLNLNQFIGKKITLRFDGQINDIHDGKPIKKSYGQGFSYKNFITLPQCDTCIIKPELCHYDAGTCRDSDWGEKNCLIDHYVYLSVSSGLKVGITRHTQTPTRWIDQGAIAALPIVKVKDRKSSGMIEIEISKHFADKTNWRKMLTGDVPEVDLLHFRDEIYDQFGDVLDEYDAEDVDADVLRINYPITKYPEKVKSISFDKISKISDTLTGIKGQYLMFGNTVINLRKHQGYYLYFEA